ncbi:hypothetical protein [Candidatus Finniella inopinata]|uniref:Uncharacterized protein n=1 Tax=Candidatus Finniella inopinata TaxID=1696036 RepID=A0A4Q7DIN7_9PROT|nr:hypothetical protein [Candidatus Finniella inopinata]RZI46079.1 hypothetical protein EQU50_03870 [Candidatus Finniella inopinata]
MNLISAKIMASSAVEIRANPYSHPSALKYQTYQWDPTRVQHAMEEALKDCEEQNPNQAEFRNQPGGECFAALIGSNHVVRLTKGTEDCKELNNANFIVKTFLEKKIDFSNDGLTICLPVRSFFLTPADGSNEYAKLFILPKAKGQCLKDSVCQGTHADCMGDIFWSVGRTLSIFQMYFMKDHGTHLTTAIHGDLHPGNIFYDRSEIMGKNQWDISWIDCTHMHVQDGNPLKELGYMIAQMEYNFLIEGIKLSQIRYFQEKFLEGYTAGVSKDLILRLYESSHSSQCFEAKVLFLAQKLGFMGDPKKLIGLIHQFFGRHLEKQSQKEKAESAQPITTMPSVAEQQEAAISQTHSDAVNIPSSSGQGSVLAVTEQVVAAVAVPASEK